MKPTVLYILPMPRVNTVDPGGRGALSMLVNLSKLWSLPPGRTWLRPVPDILCTKWHSQPSLFRDRSHLCWKAPQCDFSISSVCKFLLLGRTSLGFLASIQCQAWASSPGMSLKLNQTLVGHSCKFCASIVPGHLARRQLVCGGFVTGLVSPSQPLLWSMSCMDVVFDNGTCCQFPESNPLS